MNKKVLITVSGGVASAFADAGVDVAIIDFDNLDDADSVDDIIPINSAFKPLIELSKAKKWPISDDGFMDDAMHLASSESNLEVTLRFKPLTDLDLPPLGAPVFCLLKPGQAQKFIGNKPVVLFLTTHGYFSGSCLPCIVQPEEITQWALIPATLGGNHA